MCIYFYIAEICVKKNPLDQQSTFEFMFSQREIWESFCDIKYKESTVKYTAYMEQLRNGWISWTKDDNIKMGNCLMDEYCCKSTFVSRLSLIVIQHKISIHVQLCIPGPQSNYLYLLWFTRGCERLRHWECEDNSRFTYHLTHNQLPPFQYRFK